MITRDVRRAVGRAVAVAGFRPGADPGLRPTGTPGQYAASVALTLGPDPRATAAILAAGLAPEPWIAQVEVTGPGYLTVTVTPEALAAVADHVTAAGPACVTSDALAGAIVPAAPPGDPLTASTWEAARAALAAQLAARLAAAAGATVAKPAESERKRPPLPAPTAPAPGASRARSEDFPAEPDARARAQGTNIAAAVAFAGRDAVTFTLARAVPGQPLEVPPEVIARHVSGNPAYAVRYAHARAACGLRWAAASAGERNSSPVTSVPPGRSGTLAVSAVGPGHRDTGGAFPRETAVLLDALAWLPERVAAAARRGRPDEFARYLEDLASATIDALISARRPGNALGGDRTLGSDRLALAGAARAGLAAGLGLLGVSAPDRL